MELYTSEMIADGIYRIADIATTKMYLVVGQKEALLIDCGIGAGNVADFVRTLTDKPLRVVITHGHVDHAMGSGTFPEETPVYMSKADREIYGEHSALSIRQDYTATMQMYEGVNFDASGCTWYDVRPVDQMLDLKPGDLFDLGGEVAEICPGAGHTHGSVTVLLRRARMLLLGDACNNNIFLFDTYSCPVSVYRKTLKELKALTDGRYDRVLLCHGPGDGEMNLIDGAIWLCDAILENRDARFPGKTMGKATYSAKRPGETFFATLDQGDHSAANILYSDYTLR